SSGSPQRAWWRAIRMTSRLLKKHRITAVNTTVAPLSYVMEERCHGKVSLFTRGTGSSRGLYPCHAAEKQCVPYFYALMRLVFFLFCFILHTSTHAQSGPGLELNYMGGKILKHTPNFQPSVPAY